jgi:hypothetical protein
MSNFEPVSLEAEDIPETLPWYDVWTLALTEPTVAGYQKIASQPNASAIRAAGWIFLCALVGNIIAVVVQFLFGNSIFHELNKAIAQSGLQLPVQQIGMTYLLCAIPVSAIFTVIVMFINVFLIKFVGGLLGGSGTMDEIFYTIAAFTAPLTLISGIISGLPVINAIAGLMLGLYSIYLYLLSINVAHRFGWGKAIATILILIAVFFAIGCLLFFCVISIFGPTLGRAVQR